jgi:hypothetical protein
VFRVLQPGGRFLTQQVGGGNQLRLNQLFQEEPDFSVQLLDAGLRDPGATGCRFSHPGGPGPFYRALYRYQGGRVFLKVIDWQVGFNRTVTTKTTPG